MVVCVHELHIDPQLCESVRELHIDPWLRVSIQVIG